MGAHSVEVVTKVSVRSLELATLLQGQGRHLLQMLNSLELIGDDRGGLLVEGEETIAGLRQPVELLLKLNVTLLLLGTSLLKTSDLLVKIVTLKTGRVQLVESVLQASVRTRQHWVEPGHPKCDQAN